MQRTASQESVVGIVLRPAMDLLCKAGRGLEHGFQDRFSCFPRQVPELQHHEYPHDVTIIGLVDLLVLGPQPFQQVLPEVTSLAALLAAENIKSEIAQGVVFAHPNTVWQPESVFRL